MQYMDRALPGSSMSQCGRAVQSPTQTLDGHLVSPRLSVVICSLNGAAGVDRCLRALARQTIYSCLEIIVCDDGSTDETSKVAHAHGAIVVRHATNRGVSAARNSGVNVASARILAFLDDDCEPEEQWAEQLVAGYDKHVVGVGGPLIVSGRAGFMLGYLARHNPLQPQELDLAKSDRVAYRLCLYLKRQWKTTTLSGRRNVFSFASANMSVRREAFLAVGGLDERFYFGAEDDDLCRRLRLTFPSGHLVFVPEAKVKHHFKSSLRDTLRRSRAYGRGAARLYRKWPSVPPVFFPGPIVILAMLLLSAYIPSLAVASLAMPILIYPYGARYAIANRSALSLLDAYVQLAQDVCGDIGFIEGLWRFRGLVPEAAPETVHAAEPGKQTGLVS